MNKTISLQSDNSAFNSIPLTKEENKPIAQKSNFFGIELEKENEGANIANRVSIKENALQLKSSKFENITSFSPNTNNPPIFSKNIRAKPTLFIPIQEEPLKLYSDEPIFSSEILAKLGIESIPSEMTYEDVLLQKGIHFLPSVEATETTDDTSVDKFSKKTTDSKKSLSQHSLIGSGSFSKAYEVRLADNTPTIYKIEKKPKLLSDLMDPTKKIQRHHNFAADRLSLPHLVKTLSYFVSVELPDGRHERFDLPAKKSKEFALLLPPHATIMLEGELMLKASGKTLAQLIKEKKVSLGPDDVHFKKILIAVNEFLKAAYPHNFIHRDLKPENILYDIDSGEVTIIDKGESSRLRSRDKNDIQTLLTKGRPSTNLETSTKQLGTRDYMAPSMFEGKEYGSEVDYFSAAMIFLKLINEKDFNNFNKNRLSGTVRDVFFQEEPSQFLSIYLNKINPQHKLTTESLTTKESFFNNEKKSFSPNLDDLSPLTLNSTINTNLEMSPLEKGAYTFSPDTHTDSSLSIESNSNDSLEEGILSTEESLNKHPDVKEIIELYFQASAGGTPEAQSASRSALNKLDLIFRAYGDGETAKLDQGKVIDEV